MTARIPRSYQVSGMTCHHCALSVEEQISEVAGVEGVEVELASGRVTVRGDSLDDAAIRAAVKVAGYEVIER